MTLLLLLLLLIIIVDDDVFCLPFWFVFRLRCVTVIGLPLLFCVGYCLHFVIVYFTFTCYVTFCVTDIITLLFYRCYYVAVTFVYAIFIRLLHIVCCCRHLRLRLVTFALLTFYDFVSALVDGCCYVLFCCFTLLVRC